MAAIQELPDDLARTSLRLVTILPASSSGHYPEVSFSHIRNNVGQIDLRSQHQPSTGSMAGNRLLWSGPRVKRQLDYLTRNRTSIHFNFLL